MKTLKSTEDLAAIRRRIGTLQAEDAGTWGAMSVGQMVCHLTDSYRVAMGEFHVAPVKFPIPPGLMKWLALRLPLKWRPGFSTAPELDQSKGAGTPPKVFAEDRAVLLAAIESFVGRPQPLLTHPFFGPLTREEWMRWGYLHADHHLRQFGR